MDDEPPALEGILSEVSRLEKGQQSDVIKSPRPIGGYLLWPALLMLLLDLVLPKMTGLQALAPMKALTKAPIHLMSGQTDDDTRDDALLLGAAGFLPKPLDLKGLQALIDALPPP